jgi:lactate dehydrogenase-like 2-hydroxyacid dehydrogenase
MNIVILDPIDCFTKHQQQQLSSLGEVIYTKNQNVLPPEELLAMVKGADILGCGPEPFGGFEQVKEKLTTVMESIPNLKGLCLSTTSFGWVDLNYTKKRNITVTNVPGYSKESVAEHTIAFLLGSFKRIFISDRRTQNNTYVLDRGFELKGKTLGIIGLGQIGSIVARLAIGMGMNVIAYNRTPKKMDGVTMVSLDQLLKESDAITLHATHEATNNNMINKTTLAGVKNGVFIINTTDREIVNEQDMAEALQSRTVDTYVFEGDDLIHTPLAKVEHAIGFQRFAWYTKESIENMYEIWANNIISMAQGTPQHIVQ